MKGEITDNMNPMRRPIKCTQKHWDKIFAKKDEKNVKKETYKKDEKK